jgi:glycosyltransferase involved in cell wall biosynthesis
MSSDIVDFLVIVPTYRRPQFLAEALKSALGQPDVSKRIIVVDDCPDGSAQRITASIDASLIYLKNPHPSGGWPGRVRNFGFDAAIRLGIKARFVHFLDDDDTVPYGHYARVKQAFAAHRDIGVVFGILRPFCAFSEDAQRRERQEAQLRERRQEFARAARLAWIYHHVGATLMLGFLSKWLYRSHAIFGQYMFLCSGGIIRYEQVVALGGFDPQIRITEDYEFFTRAIRAGGAHFLERISVNYRLGSIESLWNPLEPSTQEEMHHAAEVRHYLTRRYLRLQSEFGFFRFRAKRLAFQFVTWALDTAVIPLMDRFGLNGSRRATPPKPIQV